MKDIITHYKQSCELLSDIHQCGDKQEIDLHLSALGCCGKGKKLKILDLGPGEGDLAVAAAKLGHDVTVCDISKKFLQYCRINADKHNVKLVYLHHDIEKPLGGSYDVVFMMAVIEHLHAPVRALFNVYKLLRKGGHLVLSTPNQLTWWRAAANRKLSKRKLTELDMLALHLSSYDYCQLQMVLGLAGFEIIKQIPTHLTLPVIHARSRYLGKKFPLYADDLIVITRKTKPWDIEKIHRFWLHPERYINI